MLKRPYILKEDIPTGEKESPVCCLRNWMKLGKASKMVAESINEILSYT